jgi:hypothetical protein
MARHAEARGALLSGAVLVVVAGAYLLANLRHPLDTLANPGPGVFPLAAALLLLALAAMQLGRAVGALVRARGIPSSDPAAHAGGGADQAPANQRAPSLMMAILVGYLVVVSRIGFLSSSFVLVVLCSRLMGTRGWRGPIALALGVVLCCYLLFVVWLKVPLPTGFLI